MPDTESPPARAGGGGFISRKLGPLPLWAWVAMGATLVGLYILIKRQQSAPSGTNSAVPATEANNLDALNSNVVAQMNNLNAEMQGLSDTVNANAFAQRQVTFAAVEAATNPQDAQARLTSAQNVVTSNPNALSSYNEFANRTNQAAGFTEIPLLSAPPAGSAVGPADTSKPTPTLPPGSLNPGSPPFGTQAPTYGFTSAPGGPVPA